MRSRTRIGQLRGILLLVLLVLPSFLCSCGQRPSKAKAFDANSLDSSARGTDRLSFFFVGDVMMHTPQIHAAQTSSSTYDFTPSFRLIAPYVASADVAIANLECTLGGKPYTGYPCFSAPDEVAFGLQSVGFDILTTANNHIADRGRLGILRTLTVLDSARLLHTGSFRNDAERRAKSPLMIERNNLSVGLIACTYGLNGHIVRPPVLVNLIDTARIGRDIDEALRRRADFVIVSIHWGTEYQQTPNRAQRNVAQWLLNRGVDVIIGSHPHVVQPVFVRSQLRAGSSTADTTALIAYSLGNFVSNQQDFPTRMGVSIGFTLLRDAAGHKRTADILTVPTYVSRRAKDRSVRYLVVPFDEKDTMPSDLPPPEVMELARYRSGVLHYTQPRLWQDAK